MSTLKHKKILVVDDEPLFVSSIVETLMHAGYKTVAAAKDGKEALNKANKTEFDLIITDLHMPGVDGIEFLIALSEIPFKGCLFVLSAFLNDNTERMVRQLGATACLEKPINLQELVSLIADALTHPASLVDGLTVAGLSQLLELEGKTCLLRVFSKGRQGDLVFVKGALVDAVTENDEGDRAALKIFSWNATKVQIHQTTDAQRHRTTQSLAHLVLDAVRIADEQKYAANMLLENAEPKKNAVKKSPIKKTQNKEFKMSDVKRSLDALMAIDGAIGASLVDFESGMPLGLAGGNDKFNLDVASAGNTQVVKAKLGVMDSLNLGTNIEDILITLGTQYHLIRPLTKSKSLFLYLALDRKKANLAMARHVLSQVETELQV